MKKRIIGIIFLAVMSFAVLFFVGTQDTSETKTDFTTAEFMEDYNYMWQVLEDNYLYFDVLEEQGIDASQLKEGTAERLERVTDVEGFYSLLSSLLGQMQYYAHLNVLDVHGYDLYVKYYTLNTEEAEKSAWADAVTNHPQTNAIYHHLKQGALDNSGDATQYKAVDASYDETRKAVTFVISTFDDAVVERDRNFIADYLETLNGEPVEHIIFDITGNGGGNDAYWMENMVEQFDGTYQWDVYWYMKDTPLIRKYYFQECTPDQDSLELSSLVPRLISEMPADHSVPKFVQELELTHYIKAENTLNGQAVLEEQYQNAKRWLLISERTYSAADSFSHFCRETGWATVVGRNTSGDGGGCDPVMFALPNTGLLVRFSATADENTSGGLSVRYGTAPDYAVSVQESIQAACNRIIDEESQN